MKKSLFLLIFLTVSAGALAQTTSDLRLIRETTFEDHQFEEHVPDSLTAVGRAAVLVNRQLTGECWFEPECYIFVKQAVKEFGLIPGLVITTDRLTRCSKIGTASGHHFSDDGRIHEGVEAYRVRKRRADR
ncbi:MAG: membrane protein insertion efficiency factor YidD [Bacteroidia bacterium]|nr:membrane protein insertion efficiency factor YidD [Bacteroidia bacterium]